MKQLGILFIIISIFLSSCTKDDLSKNASCGNKVSVKEPLKVNEALVYQKPSTPEEIQFVENLKKVTSVLMELFKNQDNLKVVHAAIYAKVYTDETVLLRDLIYPESGIVATNYRFLALTKQLNVSLASFTSSFWDEINKKGDPAFSAFLQSIKPDSPENNEYSLNKKLKSAKAVSFKDVSIYFPYSENFAPKKLKSDPNEYGQNPDGSTYLITSVVTATEEADQGIGYAQYYDTAGVINYDQVLIDDDYAYNNPTLIVGLNGIEPYGDATPPSTYSLFLPSDSIDLPNLNIGRSIHSVYVGEVRCTHQYDHLISFTGNCGGSEIRFTRSSGYLKLVDNQVQADNFILDGPPSISRKDIREGNWVVWNILWDEDWEAANKEQFFAIYEDDNCNSASITGSLKTTLKLLGLPVEGNIGFTLNYKSKDDIIKQSVLKYSSFFALNRIDLEGAMHNGWPVKDNNGGVSYTLWDKTIY
jgi:hypothetical protein